MSSSPPLVTVVITCYNHSKYLPEAIESIRCQTYRHFKIIVVDDGSTDNTKEVVSKYAEIYYVYQTNQGLSAARNTGANHCSGDAVLFLDADDWLLPEALAINVLHLEKDQNLAFVSGAFKVFKAGTKEELAMQKTVLGNHFNHLLEFNYISMHGTVLYRRWVFNEFKFDITLKACEDYDLYLRVARKYRVLHHTDFIAMYRFHDSNMSYNTILMMNSALDVIKKQEQHLKTETERKSFKKGIENFKLFYCKVIYAKYLLSEQKTNPNRHAEMKVLWQNYKAYYFKFFLKRIFRILSMEK